MWEQQRLRTGSCITFCVIGQRLLTRTSVITNSSDCWLHCCNIAWHGIIYCYKLFFFLFTDTTNSDISKTRLTWAYMNCAVYFTNPFLRFYKLWVIKTSSDCWLHCCNIARHGLTYFALSLLQTLDIWWTLQTDISKYYLLQYLLNIPTCIDTLPSYSKIMKSSKCSMFSMNVKYSWCPFWV